ncbi:putative inner membrane protein DUF1819 [Ruminococcaceae bacterium R-25]|nr:putative inner membrane protein DUF1819 [Ruminococcaceae bacterium R-25]SUQ11019.1 Putative inner membrane protein [Oscillospiraceae bacterium]
MKRNEYSASAVKHQFWFNEFRQTVKLLNDGRSLEQIKRLVLEDNLYSASSSARAKQIYATVSARINELDSSFYRVFSYADLQTQKMFALIAAMAYDTLLFEIVYELIRDKMILGSNEITEKEFVRFIEDKQRQDSRAASWTEETCKRLAGTYKSILFEAGVLDSNKGDRKILKPIIDLELSDWLSNHGMEIYIKALTGVR